MSFELPVIFGAGLLSFASPCVLPLIPIFLGTLAGTVKTEDANTKRLVASASAFALGLSAVFVALGAFAGSLGGLIQTYSGWFVGLSAALMVLFGLRSLGLLRVGVMDRDARPLLAKVSGGGGMLAAFVFGAAFAFGWSPCIGPVLAALLTYAATHAESSWQSAGYLAVYAAGFSAPLLALSFMASRAVGWIRRMNRHLPRIEQATGVLLLAVAAFIVYGEFGKVPGRSDLGTAEAAVDGGSCETAKTGSNCELEPQAEAHDDRPLPTAAAQGPLHTGPHVLEFVATSCPACERMRPVLHRVEQACERDEAPTLAVDVGTKSGRALAAGHRVRGTPTFVFVGEDGKEVTRLIGETSAERFVATISDSFGVNCQL